MAVALYGATGTLTADLASTAGEWEIDSTLATYIRARVQSDVAYLRIQDATETEIVGVTADLDGTIRLRRAQDNTVALCFAAGAVIDYTLTVAEIKSAGLQQNVVLGDSAAIRVNDLEVSYRMPTPTTLGGAVVRVHDSVLELDTSKGLFGCCDGGLLVSSPPLPPSVQYLTTQLYPLEVGDNRAQFQTQYGSDIRNGIVPNPIDPWLLWQPEFEEQLGYGQFFTTMTLYGAIKNAADDGYLVYDQHMPTLTITDLVHHGYGQDFAQSDLLLYIGQLKAILITNVQPYETVSASAQLTSGVLETIT